MAIYNQRLLLEKTKSSRKFTQIDSNKKRDQNTPRWIEILAKKV